MIIHVDMSNRYYQKRYSVVACVSVDFKNKNNHLFRKGAVITEPLRSKLIKEYSVVDLHAALISLLIKDCIKIKKLIICSDVNPVEEVMSCILKIKGELFGRLKSIEELREEIGLKGYKSAADSFARNINRNYPKKANTHRSKRYFADGTVVILSSEDPKGYELLNKYLKKRNKKSEFKRSNR